jgi:hypothetical protein
LRVRFAVCVTLLLVEARVIVWLRELTNVRPKLGEKTISSPNSASITCWPAPVKFQVNRIERVRLYPIQGVALKQRCNADCGQYKVEGVGGFRDTLLEAL